MRHVFFDLLWLRLLHQSQLSSVPSFRRKTSRFLGCALKGFDLELRHVLFAKLSAADHGFYMYPLVMGEKSCRNGLVSWSQKFDPTQNHAELTTLLDQDAQVYHHLGLTPQFSDTCKSSWMCICVICIYIYTYDMLHMSKKSGFWPLKAEYCAKPSFLGICKLKAKKTYICHYIIYHHINHHIKHHIIFTTFYPILSQEWLVHPHLRPYTGEDSSARPQEYWMMWMLHINSAWWFFLAPQRMIFRRKWRV